MTETPLMQKIRLAVGKLPTVRLFRNNVGMGWQGKAVHQGSHVVIENPRPLHAGLCEGSSDLIGWKTVEVTADMVGKRIAVFTAIEVKTDKGRTSPQQRNFIQRVQEAGGIAGVARSENDAIYIVKQ